MDDEIIAELEALVGLDVNPSMLDYACHAVDVRQCTQLPLEDVGWPADEPLQALSADDFKMTEARARQVLQDSVDHLESNFASECMGIHAKENLQQLLGLLDPTQSMVHAWVERWLHERGRWVLGMPAPANQQQLLLLGTAGTGKTTTVRAAVEEVRTQCCAFDAVIMVAHTGVAANNMGIGALTIDTFFKLAGENKEQDLTSEAADAFVAMVRQARMLVIDEISMVNPEQLLMISRRLEQAAKQIFRERYDREPPDSFGGFGGLIVVLVGDFGQIPPVRAESLMQPLHQASIKKNKQSQSKNLQGKLLFRSISTVVQLRRIYRQKEADAFKDSTMNLRDGIVTESHHKHWTTHELTSERPAPDWPGSERILSHGLTLAFENLQVGRINGQTLRGSPKEQCYMEQVGSVPELKHPQKAILRCTAFHGEVRAASREPMSKYRNLRPYNHLQLGAPVMLTTNNLWKEFVVPLGLMNGARGRIVAVLYKPEGQARTDGLQAPTGYPNGLDGIAPLPDMVIVHFPGYKGNAFFPHLPATWVPVCCMQQRHEHKNWHRIGLPLRLCWAITCHKCQGITEENGCIIDFKTRVQRNAVADLGLAFVASTRSTSFAVQAYRGLPPRMDFIAVRNTNKFKARVEFEAQCADKHDASMQELRGWTRSTEYDAHVEWWLRAKEDLTNTKMFESGFMSSTGLTADEHASLKTMLSSRGVHEFPPGMLQEMRHAMKAPGASLAALVPKFRQQGKVGKVHFGVTKLPGQPRTPATEMQAKRKKACDDVQAQFLVAEGYSEALAKQAVAQCVDLIEALDFCSAHASDAQDAQQLANSMASAENVIRHYNYMLCQDRFHKGQWKMLQAAGKRRMKRSTDSPVNLLNRSGDAYLARMQQVNPRATYEVIDCGTRTDPERYNACFWLATVAAWTQLPPQQYDLEEELRHIQLQVLDLARTTVTCFVLL